MKPFPWKCTNCRKPTLAPATLPEYRTTIQHDGRPYEIVLNNLDVLLCSACETIVLLDEAEIRLETALRAAAGLLLPQEIRARREALGLTQKQLASTLRIAEATVSRWESGGQIQQRVMDLLLRAYFDLPPLRAYLGALNETVEERVGVAAG